MKQGFGSRGILAAPIVSVAVFITMQVRSQGQPRPANDLQLAAVLSAALRLDTQQKAPAFPAAGNLLSVTATGVDVNLPSREIVELSPALTEPGFEPQRVVLFVNEAPVESKSVDGTTLPAFRFEMPPIGPAVRRVRLLGEDAFRKQVTVMKCTIRRDAGVGRVAFEVRGGSLQLARPIPQTKALYVYYGDAYLGCIGGDLSKYAADARAIPAGRHVFKLIPQSDDGSVSKPVETTIDVAPRFSISCSAQQGAFQVEGDKLSVPVKVARKNAEDIAKAIVLLEGNKVGESDQAEFEIPVKLSEVYSGSSALEVIGVGKDGFQYPPEAIEIKVQNYLLNTSPLAQQLGDALKHIEELDQQIAYWYTRATNERDTETRSGRVQDHTTYSASGFAQTVTTTYFASVTRTPGHQAEYWANCKKAVVERVQTRIVAGKLLKQMNKRRAARAAFQRAVHEAGEGTPLAAEAAGYLRDL